MTEATDRPSGALLSLALEIVDQLSLSLSISLPLHLYVTFYLPPLSCLKKNWGGNRGYPRSLVTSPPENGYTGRFFFIVVATPLLSTLLGDHAVVF